MRKTTFKLLPVVTAIGVTHSIAEAQFLGPQQVNKLPSSPADHRIHYGSDPLQFGELRLPQSSGRHPVAVVIHGGCWKSRHGDLIADLQNTAALSSALTSLGIATWNIEYRQTDNPGGGWTGTFQDVANAIDYLRVLAKSYPLDLKRVVVVGHSAGGHLGTWAAARHRLPKRSPLLSKEPLRVVGVVNLAGPTDLESIVPIQTQLCGAPVITSLIGGSPSEVPERYRQASPSKLLPIGVKQVLITGAQDKLVPPQWGQKYEEEAKKARDDVSFVAVENASHFEVIAPGSVAWPKVEEAVLSMLRLKRRTSK
ncbi:MAG TPA: alpha/beta hydrolase [Chthonomonadales bacterium]|nr:alpha/beta hydrolase [Chthonomonadales bacterium]